jgi:hypothetical protein
MSFNSISALWGLVLALSFAASLGCQKRMISTAKPKPPILPATLVRLPDLDMAALISPTETIRLPALQKFQVNVKLKNVDATMRENGFVTLLFQPLTGSEDAKMRWNYGAAVLTPKDASASTWECTGICEGVAKPVPMRGFATLGPTIPIAEFKVQGISDFKSDEE